MPIYEKRAVLFIDILGFRSLIDPRREEDVLAALTAFSPIGIQLQDAISSDFDFQMTTFSDSIVCSLRIPTRNNYLPAAYLVECAGHLSLQMMIRGILVRGAITVGDLYHQENTVFGPGLIAAYELESTLAQYPRIIVPRKVYGQINMSLMTVMSPEWFMLNEPFRGDFDGVVHLDIFGQYYIRCRPNKLLLKGKNSLKDLGPVTGRLVNKLCARRHNNQRISTKYEWLKSYYVDCCARFGWKNSFSTHRIIGALAAHVDAKHPKL